MGLQVFWSIAYLASLLIVGYGMIVWLGGSYGRLEQFGLSACLGPALVGWYLIGLSLMGHVPSRAAIGIVTIIGASLIAKQLRRRNRISRRIEENLVQTVSRSQYDSWWTALTLIVVIGASISVVHQASLATLDWDAFAIWQLKARVLSLQAMVPRPDYFFNANASFSHLRYPILVPMISAGALAMVGPTDVFGKMPNILVFFGIAAVIFGALCRIRGAAIATAVTCTFLLLPNVLNRVGVGTADFLLTAFYACSLICLLRWQQEQNWRDLILTMLFSAAMTWTKNEGLPIAAINSLAILFLTPRPWIARHLSAFAIFSIGIAAIYVVWPIYCHGFPRTDEDYASHLTIHEILGHLGRVPHLLAAFINAFADENRWSIFWFILIAMPAINIRSLGQRAVLSLWLLLLAQLGILVFAYTIVATQSLDWLISTSIDRVVIHLTPPAAMLIGLHWPKLNKAVYEDNGNGRADIPTSRPAAEVGE